MLQTIPNVCLLAAFLKREVAEGSKGGNEEQGRTILSIVLGLPEQHLSFGAGQDSLEGVENLVKRWW